MLWQLILIQAQSMKSTAAFVIVILSSFSAPRCGATIYNSDGSAANVQALTNIATDGDTITLPAGTFVWTTGSTITKGITLQGAGSDLTVIERSGTAPLIQIQGLPSDLPVRVTGIRFNAHVGQNGDLTSIYVTGPSGGTWGLTQIRIDNCYFYGGQRNIVFLHRASGVVDHCTFQDVAIATEVYGDDDYAWARAGAPQFGTADTTVFFEDNYFIADGAITYFDTLGDTFTGGRFTWRHNTFDLSAFSAWNFGSLITAHGNQAYWTGINDWNRGGIMCEFYENNVIVSSAYRLLWFRGGRNLVANNTFSGIISAFVHFSEEEPSSILPLRIGGWNAEDQVNNTFVWANTVNGQPQTDSMVRCWDTASDTFIQLGRDYWLVRPSSNTVTNYPQPGLPSLPGYPSPYSSPVTSWMPYTYPHPLTGSGPGPTPTPTATPSPTATPPPCVATVPNFVGARMRTAATLWEQAGFSPANITITGGPGRRITWQSLPAGSLADCATATITVGP